MTKEYTDGIARRKTFYYENPEAKKFVNDLLDKGFSTLEALNQMRWQFAKEYFEWKKKKGFNFITHTDELALKLKRNEKKS